MRRLGDLAVGDLFEGVEAVAAGVEGVHQMHGGRFAFEILERGCSFDKNMMAPDVKWRVQLGHWICRFGEGARMKFLVMRLWPWAKKIGEWSAGVIDKRTH